MGLLSDLARHLRRGPDPLRFDPDAIARAEPLKNAPPGFLLGAATSAHQIEGSLRNDWTEWEKGTFPDGRPHIVDRTTSQPAADSWNRWRDDVRCLEVLGANAYRLGLEWARLEPEPGAWDDDAAARYRTLLETLREKDITPLVTLWHFTLPLWLSSKGGFEWAGAVEAFERYAERCARTFGDLVDRWCTINEPNVYAMKSYGMGDWPPGGNDTARAARIQAALVRAHAAGARALRTHDTVDADGDGHATRIGVAQHLRVFEPASRNPVDFVMARLSEGFFNWAFLDSVRAGRVRVSVPGLVSIDEPCADLAGSLDWLGVNYYSRDFVAFDWRRPLMPRLYTPAERPKNDLGWDIYPEGLTRLLVKSGEYGWPILVTENGIADRTGEKRPGYLQSHLYALERAMAQNVDVRGYFHWSLIDNFEWAEGYTGRFGLFSIDFGHDAELTRRPTAAVAEFQKVARRLGRSPVDEGLDAPA